MQRSRSNGMDDPYLESLGRNPLFKPLMGRRWKMRILRIALVWSAIAMTLALLYVLYILL